PPSSTLFPYTTLFRSLGSRPGTDGAGPKALGSLIDNSEGCAWPGSVELGSLPGAVSAGPKALGSRALGSRPGADGASPMALGSRDRKSTRLNSSHVSI